MKTNGTKKLVPGNNDLGIETFFFAREYIRVIMEYNLSTIQGFGKMLRLYFFDTFIKTAMTRETSSCSDSSRGGGGGKVKSANHP